MAEEAFDSVIKNMVDVKDNAELNLLQVSEMDGLNADSRRLFYICRP